MKQKFLLLILLVGTLFSCKEDNMGEIRFPEGQKLAVILPASDYIVPPVQ